METSEITSILQTIFTGIGVLIPLIGGIYAAYRKFSNRKPKIKIRVWNGMLTSGPELSDAMLFISVANDSEKAVNIVAVEFLWQNQPFLIPYLAGQRQLPMRLAPQESADFWHPLRDIANACKHNGATGTVKVKGRARDAVGNRYLSKGFGVKSDGWKETPYG